MFPVVGTADCISAPELCRALEPACRLAGAMGLSVLSRETGDSPHPMGQKAEGESGSESCQLSAEPDLQAASLLCCAMTYEATSFSWRRQGI